MLILPDKESAANVKWGNSETKIDGFSIVIIPRGESEIKVTKGGQSNSLV